jgi:predicted regulator of Ras-like GTPase activity (Roadblock/LC7/MglB family)
MTMSFPSQPPHRTTSTGSHLDRLLDDLVARAAHVQKAAVISRDGFALGVSAGLSREDAEHLSALAAGLQSLASGGAIHFGGGKVHQTVIEMERGFLFVTAAGEGSCLAVLAAPQADVGLLGYEMALVVKRLGRRPTVAGRTAPSSSSSPR